MILEWFGDTRKPKSIATCGLKLPRNMSNVSEDVRKLPIVTAEDLNSQAPPCLESGVKGVN